MCNVNLTKYVGKNITYEINKQKQEIENKNKTKIIFETNRKQICHRSIYFDTHYFTNAYYN